MIRTLEIERLKSIRHLKLHCRKVNVFLGPPDSGKTNILEAVQLYSCLGWGVPICKSLRLSSEVGYQNMFYRNFHDQPVTVTSDIGQIAVSLRGTDEIGIDVRTGQHAQQHNVGFGSGWQYPAFQEVRCYAYTFPQQWQYQPGSLAGVVQPPNGWNLIHIARHITPVYEYFRELVSQMGFKIRFDANQKRFYFCEIRRDDIFDYGLDLLSDSLKRMFFYASILLTSTDAILGFDEPDVYAFPPYPKNLGEMIAQDTPNQFFLTTHNPYFLAALMEKTPKDRIAVFVCSRDAEGATTTKLLSDEQVGRAIEAGANVFFNLDELAK